jgi:hypothetical protein
MKANEGGGGDGDDKGRHEIFGNGK